MMRMDSLTNKRDLYKEGLRINKDILIALIIGFLLARANVLNKLTPFGYAFLASYIIIKGANVPLLISVVISTCIFQGFNGVGYIGACIFLYSYFTIIIKEKSYSLIIASLVATTIFACSRILGICIDKTVFIYDIFMALFESIVVFTMIYVFSFSVPIDQIKGTNFTNEKIVCSFIILALTLAGINNISIFDIGLKNLFSISMILCLSYNQGVFIGGTTGIILGMIAYISEPEMPFIIGIFGISGILAGIFKDLGKSGCAIGFLLGNGIISFYINGLGTSFLNTKELILGIILFLIIANKFDTKIIEAFSINLNTKKDYIKKRDEIVIRKLDRMVELFNNLSATFKESAEEREMHSTGEVYGVVDCIANNVCKDCYKCEKCWGTNYYGTYQNLFNLVGLVEMKTGEDNAVYEEAKKCCVRYGEIIDVIDRTVDKLKLNHGWKLKLKENRLLLSEQLESVGRIIEDLTANIYSNSSFNDEVEQNLYKELKNNRIDIREVSVTQIGQEDFEIFIDLNSSIQEKNKLKDMVSKCLGFPVVSDTNFRENGKTHRFKLIRQNRFSAITKMANMPNSEGRICGDSFTFGEIENTHFSAISDGMGIGRKASEESKVAISLLERLMDANVDKNLTLRTINSVLRAKSNEEIFTTLDLSFIDLYSGKLQMIKTGSPATFIKKKDRVDVINANTLPVGILKDVDFNIYEEYIEDGDIIIMLSDGVLEANRGIDNTESWMKNIITNIDSLNPQTIAREILKEANKVISNDRDDMTVLVTKVWKNV